MTKQTDRAMFICSSYSNYAEFRAHHLDIQYMELGCAEIFTIDPIQRRQSWENKTKASLRRRCRLPTKRAPDCVTQLSSLYWRKSRFLINTTSEPACEDILYKLIEIFSTSHRVSALRIRVARSLVPLPTYFVKLQNAYPRAKIESSY